MQQNKSKKRKKYAPETSNTSSDSFLSKIKENSSIAQVQIEKSKGLTKEYMSKYDMISEENKRMNQTILDMNNQYRKLDFQLKKSQSTISQMQINDENSNAIETKINSMYEMNQQVDEDGIIESSNNDANDRSVVAALEKSVPYPEFAAKDTRA